MGIVQSKTFNNFTLPFRFETKLSQQIPCKGFTSNDYSEDHLVPTYSFKTKHFVSSNRLAESLRKLPSHLTLLTYNVWFQSANTSNRYPCLMKIISESKADIICLQEVNSQFLSNLHQCMPLLQDQYFMPVTKMQWYDTLILSKYPCRFYKKQFEVTSMGRCNLIALIQFQKNENLAETSEEKGQHKHLTLAINTVHLQSLNNEAIRMKQLESIKSYNKDIDINIIAGDFNFSDGWKQNSAISEYEDIWKTGLRHFSKEANEEMKQVGYTMLPTDRYPSWRPDHIIIKKKHQKEEKLQSNGHQIGIVGDFTVPPYESAKIHQIINDGIVRTPSDHFGLLAKIKL